MAELKTKVNEANVEDFLNAIADENKRKDSFEILSTNCFTQIKIVCVCLHARANSDKFLPAGMESIGNYIVRKFHTGSSLGSTDHTKPFLESTE